MAARAATKEELEAFVTANKRWLPDDVEQTLRAMSAVDQRRVIMAGTMSSVRDPAAVVQARVRKARELEGSIARGGPIPAGGLDGETRLSKPASKEELESFIKANDRWLIGEACDILRAMSPVDQKRVISAGTMSGCRDPVAVIQTRAKKAREMEIELENLAAGKAPTPVPEPPQMPPPPIYGEAAAAMHLYAPPEVVKASHSRFASAAATASDEPEEPIGNEKGIGGSVEILKAKYGCGKGQRLKVIGETGDLLKFEGGKTAPKIHEGTGWRWVMREEEQSKSAAQKAAEEARVAEAQKAAEAEAARKAAEHAEAHRQAAAYAQQQAQAAAERAAASVAAAASASANSKRTEAAAAAREERTVKENSKKEESSSSSSSSEDEAAQKAEAAAKAKNAGREAASKKKRADSSGSEVGNKSKKSKR